MARTKYRHPDRASAEAALVAAENDAATLAYMLGRQHCLEVAESGEDEEGNPVRIRVRIWCRPRSGVAYFAMWCGDTMIDRGGSVADAAQYRRRNRFTRQTEIIGDALDRAESAANALMFGRNIA